MNDQDIKKIFKAHSVEFSNEGFSERIAGLLPERKSILPQIIIMTSIVISLGLIIAMQGFSAMAQQFHSLVSAISRMQIPSITSVITYLCIVAMTGVISYSIEKVAEY